MQNLSVILKSDISNWKTWHNCMLSRSVPKHVVCKLHCTVFPYVIGHKRVTLTLVGLKEVCFQLWHQDSCQPTKFHNPFSRYILDDPLAVAIINNYMFNDSSKDKHQHVIV